MKRLLVVEVAGLGHGFLQAQAGGDTWRGLTFRPVASVFPAVTCTVQATMRTALLPSRHGMVANGVWLRNLRRASFWEQSSGLVEGERIWQSFRQGGRRVGMLFWQQSLGEDVDVLLSPWPVHKHGGGLVDTTHSKPAGLYDELCQRIGRRFKLMHYWGPLASAAASDWIARATVEVMGLDLAPDLLFTYLPHLDYSLQRHPATDRRNTQAFGQLRDCLALLHNAAERHGYDLLVFGDYAIGPAQQVRFPNRVLRAKGLLETRPVKRECHVNLHESAAFAMVDHEVAHVYVRDPARQAEVETALRTLGDDVDVLSGERLAAAGIAHPNCGEIVLAGKPGTWFAYPWWDDAAEAPGYAAHVDIHNKPGYDPAELFFGWHPFVVSLDPTRVKGTHGAVDPNRQATWACTADLGGQPADHLELAVALKRHLES